jgi:hypothetical protein
VVPMLGFKRFFNARRVVAGVELVQKIVKGQFEDARPDNTNSIRSALCLSLGCNVLYPVHRVDRLSLDLC